MLGGGQRFWGARGSSGRVGGKFWGPFRTDFEPHENCKLQMAIFHHKQVILNEDEK